VSIEYGNPYRKPCGYSTGSDQNSAKIYFFRIIIGSDRRPETKQGIEGKRKN